MVVDYSTLMNDLKNKIFRNVYLIYGEEYYFIDQIADYFENNVLQPHEKDFNLIIVYGKDTDIPTIVTLAKRYPMISDYQIVLVKEAQELKGFEKNDNNTEILIEYILNPVKSTILIFCCNKETFDKRTKLYKAFDKTGIVFESKKLTEEKIAKWIKNFFLQHNKIISDKTIDLLIDYLGNNLTLISNELNKLLLYSENIKEISVNTIERVVGASRDFNNFELIKAIGVKNIAKACRIILYFSQNPKENPVERTIGLLHNFFTKLLILKDIQNKTDKEISEILDVPLFYLNEYKTASKNYSTHMIINAIHLIKDYDAKIKGIDCYFPSHELLKELIFKIMYIN
ncbi:MAG: DNA polymerase III subunit delta [Bacteroidales bacterium]|nr:DNA polymerase III subunit delta [Bacteroidales bacterium]